MWHQTAAHQRGAGRFPPLAGCCAGPGRPRPPRPRPCPAPAAAAPALPPACWADVAPDTDGEVTLSQGALSTMMKQLRVDVPAADWAIGRAM